MVSVLETSSSALLIVLAVALQVGSEGVSMVVESFNLRSDRKTNLTCSRVKELTVSSCLSKTQSRTYILYCQRRRTRSFAKTSCIMFFEIGSKISAIVVALGELTRQQYSWALAQEKAQFFFY